MARQLSITDPMMAGLQMLRELELEAEGESATPRQRTDIELMLIQSIALQGNDEEAIERALAITGSLQALDQRVKAMRLAARLAINSGRYELAFTQLNNALSLLDEFDSPKEKAMVFGTVSTFHSRSGDSWLAMDYAERAMSSAKQANDPRLECMASTWLGQAHAAMDDFAPAAALGQRALELCERVDDKIMMIRIRNLLARLALATGELDSAERLLDDALEENQGLFHHARIESELVRARIHLERGGYAAALDRYQALSKELGSSQRRDQLANAFDGAAEAARRMGDLETAAAFYKAKLGISREHMEQTNSLRLAQLSMGFDQALQTKEISLLREQERFDELTEQSRIQRRRLLTLALIGGIASALLLLTGLVHTLKERRHYRRLADRDGLTKLFNHTRFFKQFEREMEKRRNQTLVLILADIDHFKQVNDRFGHQIGDEVLRQTARLLREIFGEEQLIGRIGGEEFAIRLLDYSQDQAVERVQTLRNRLTGKMRRRTDPPITLSFGLGVAEADESLESLRKRTDEALYRAKSEGRHRLVIAQRSADDAAGSTGS